MAIVPGTLEAAELETIETLPTIEPSKTYQLRLDQLGGLIDGEEAVKQFITKAIRTPRNRLLIYDDQYGSELEDLIGANATRELLSDEIPRVITEAIIYDDRIESVSNFTVIQDGDKTYITFSVGLVSGGTIKNEVTV